MDNKTLKVLEYNKIIARLESLISSSMGKELVKHMKPDTNVGRIRYQLQLTEEGRSLHMVDNFAVRGFKDIRRAVNRASIGAVLDGEDLINTADTLRAARNTRSFLLKRKDEYPKIAEVSANIVEAQTIEDKIYYCIEPEGTVKDDASVKLKSLRSRIRSLKAAIKSRINSMVRSPEYEKYLQESIVTVRNERYVLPVKAEYKGQIKGLVHDQSASGATLFIEPMAIVEINNELKQVETEAEHEVARIMRELSYFVAENVELIEQNGDVLSVIDFVLAKGKLSAQMNAVRPKINEEGRISLCKARHPLIDPHEVVPIDVELGDEFHILVITGPNTGGKTVSLKTVGLLQLMAQSGLHIPAGLHSEVTIFDDVFADIGDEQSIEQSLSTFSSHMTNIIRILKKANHRSLVLFDELGAGTDPAEGAALAMAILDEMYNRGVRTIATTHYSELKSYAYNKSGVINGSVEFDIETLKPTYRLSIGVPGRSNAFLISQRLGLSTGLISKAKTYISKEVQQVEDMITDLEQSKKRAETESIEAERLRQQVKELREKYEDKLSEIEDMEKQIRREALKEARLYTGQMKKQMELIIEELKSDVTQGDHAYRDNAIRIAREKMKKRRTEIDSEVDALSETEEIEYDHEADDSLAKGDSVIHVQFRKKGVILTDPNENGEVQVQMGALKLWTPLERLTKVKAKKREKTRHKARIITARKNVPLELDIRGQTVTEAQIVIDKYLDDALLTGRAEVSIIHGKGTGALRRGVRKYLDHHPLVKEHRLGHAGEGGAGISVVTIKQ